MTTQDDSTGLNDNNHCLLIYLKNMWKYKMGKKYTTLMLKGAFVCVAASIFLVWRITSTGDARMEWIVWVLLLLGFILFGVYCLQCGEASHLLKNVWD